MRSFLALLVFFLGIFGGVLGSSLVAVAAGKRQEREIIPDINQKRTKVICMAVSSPPSQITLDFFNLLQRPYLRETLPVRLQDYFAILKATWATETFRYLSEYEKKVLAAADSDEADSYGDLTRELILAEPLLRLRPTLPSYELYEWQNNPRIADITLTEHLQFLQSFLHRAARQKMATNWDFINEYLGVVLQLAPDTQILQVQQILLKPVLATLQFDSFRVLWGSRRREQPIPQLYETVLELAAWLDLVDDCDDQRFWFKVWQLIGPAPIHLDVPWSVDVLFSGEFTEQEMLSNGQLCETLASIKPVKITSATADWKHFHWLLFKKKYYDLAAVYPYHLSSEKFFEIVGFYLPADHRSWFICWDTIAVLLLHTTLDPKLTYMELVNKFQRTLVQGESRFKAQMMAQVYFFLQRHQFRHPNTFSFPRLEGLEVIRGRAKAVHEVIGQETLYCVGRVLLFKYFGVPLYASRIKTDWEEVGIEEVVSWMQTVLMLQGRELQLSVLIE